MSDHLTFKNRLLGLQSNLLNFAYQLTTNRDAAQDLVQDTTLKVLDNESKYVDNVNFKGWVFTIMREKRDNRRPVRRPLPPQPLTGVRPGYTGRLIRRQRNIGCDQRVRPGIQSAVHDVHSRIQIQRNRRKDGSSARNGKEPHILRTQTSADNAQRLPLTRNQFI